MYTIGIDMGSVGTKAVLFNGGIVDAKVVPTGWSPKNAGNEVLNYLMDKHKVKSNEVSKIITTGYGRNVVDFSDKAITEITCHAKGAHFLFDQVDMILDIGGQDSKVIAVDESGNVKDFMMNEKCAAGTGRFLQVMANLLEYDIEAFSHLSKEMKPEKISSMCTVFAETEVVSLLASGASKEAVALGILDSVANRASSMMGKFGMAEHIVFTGGVSKSSNLVYLLEQRIGKKIYTSDKSQLAGALGAAIIGMG